MAKYQNTEQEKSVYVNYKLAGNKTGHKQS